MIVGGIDPGVQGAISYIDYNSCGQSTIVAIFDMPIDKVEKAGHYRSMVNRFSLLSIVRQYPGVPMIVERPDFRPMIYTDRKTGRDMQRQVGAAGMGSFGISYGCVLMATTVCDVSLTEISPGSWKRAMSVKGDKDDARRRAQETFPAGAGYFVLKKHDGRAEATLMAVYHARKLIGNT